MKYFTPFIIGFVAMAVIVGFFVAGSPGRSRKERFDQRRLNDLQYLQSEIVVYWQNKGKLPEKLADLNDTLRGVSVPADPQTGSEYRYAVKTIDTFVLCADFALANDSPSGKGYPEGIRGPYLGDSSNWAHQEGHTCFERTIDKDFFKQNSGFAPRPVAG